MIIETETMYGIFHNRVGFQMQFYTHRSSAILAKNEQRHSSLLKVVRVKITPLIKYKLPQSKVLQHKKEREG